MSFFELESFILYILRINMLSELTCLCFDKEYDNIERYLGNPVNDPSINQQQAIRMAGIIGDVRIVELLLRDERVDLHTNNEEPFRLACRHGNYNLVRYLLENFEIDVHACHDYRIKEYDDYKYIPCEILYVNVYDIIEDIIQHNFWNPIIIRRNDESVIRQSHCYILWEDTVFWEACCGGNLDIVELLMGLELNINSGSNMALYCATYFYHNLIVRRLLNNNRRVRNQDFFNCWKMICDEHYFSVQKFNLVDVDEIVNIQDHQIKVFKEFMNVTDRIHNRIIEESIWPKHLLHPIPMSRREHTYISNPPGYVPGYDLSISIDPSIHDVSFKRGLCLRKIINGFHPEYMKYVFEKYNDKKYRLLEIVSHYLNEYDSGVFIFVNILESYNKYINDMDFLHHYSEDILDMYINEFKGLNRIYMIPIFREGFRILRTTITEVQLFNLMNEFTNSVIRMRLGELVRSIRLRGVIKERLKLREYFRNEVLDELAHIPPIGPFPGGVKYHDGERRFQDYLITLE